MKKYKNEWKLIMQYKQLIIIYILLYFFFL